MKNTIAVIALIFIFVGVLVFANTFVKNYPIHFEIDGVDSTGKIEVSDNIEENNGKNNKKEEEKMEILKVTNENFEEEVLKNEGTVLIDFYADWCGPCKMMVPVVEKIAEENPDLKVVKVNIDEEESLAIQYRVMSIPTFLVMKNGEVVNKVVGAGDKMTLEDMVK